MKRNKKAIALVLAALIAAAAAGCGSTSVSSAGASSQPMTSSSSSVSEAAASEITYSDDAQNLGEEGDLANGHIKITACNFFADGLGFWTIKWTNDTNEETTFDNCFDVQIYQNGEKLNRRENATSITNTSGVTFDPQELSREVQPGATITVYYPFDLLPNSISGDQIVYDSLRISIYSKGDNSKKVEFTDGDVATSNDSEWSSKDFSFYDLSGHEIDFITEDNSMISLFDEDDIGTQLQTYKGVQIGDQASSLIDLYDLSNFKWGYTNSGKTDEAEQEHEKMKQKYSSAVDVLTHADEVTANDTEIFVHGYFLEKADGSIEPCDMDSEGEPITNEPEATYLTMDGTEEEKTQAAIDYYYDWNSYCEEYNGTYEFWINVINEKVEDISISWEAFEPMDESLLPKDSSNS